MRKVLIGFLLVLIFAILTGCENKVSRYQNNLRSQGYRYVVATIKPGFFTGHHVQGWVKPEVIEQFKSNNVKGKIEFLSWTVEGDSTIIEGEDVKEIEVGEPK